MGSGGDTQVEYAQSPEQRQLMNAYMPMAEGLGQYGQERYFGGEPNLGAPSMNGVLTGQQMYDIPDPSSAMPTQQWWNSLSPEVMAGLNAPWEDQRSQMLEFMGQRGQTGSGQGGYSGAAGAAIGELAGNAAQNIGLNAWEMTSPMAQASWQADLQRNMNAYNVGQQERMGDYNTAMQAWQMPYQSMNNMIGQGMPQGYAQQGSGGVGNALSGAMMGGMGGSMFGPWGTALGALGGGLSGLFG